MRNEEETAVRFVIGLIGAILGYIISNRAYTYFIETGVTPDVAMWGSIVVFALVLAAFGLVAVKVNL